jgi:glucarate dehydratase
MLQRLEPFDLDFVEAPIDARNLSAMRELRASSSIPIAANEGMWSLREAAEAIRQGACDVVVVGPMWLGGLKPLQHLAALCAAHDVGYCHHAPPASSIATAAALHVLSTIPSLEDGNQSYYPRHLRDDVADGLGSLERGKLAVPLGPGLGIDVDESRVAAHAERYLREGGFPQQVPKSA